MAKDNVATYSVDLGNKGLTTGIELGATIPTVSYGNIKLMISIQGIDVNGNVEDQVEAALNAATLAFGKLDEKIITLVDEAATASGGGLKIDERLAKVEAQNRKLAKHLGLIN